MKLSYRVIVSALLIAGAGVSGCASGKRALGLQAAQPDEFQVLAKVPLTLPPDYALRPPAPGKPRPDELRPESKAREALLGQRAAENRTEGERLLANKAGADRADPLIRYVVDDEYGDLAYKDKSFADKVMFWRPDVPAAAAVKDPAVTTPTPVDAAAEQKRIAAMTGGKPVVIHREGPPRRKLPGL